MSVDEARVLAAEEAGAERAADMTIIPLGVGTTRDVVEAAKNMETTETAIRRAWPEIDGSGFADDPIVEPRGDGEFACRGCFLIKLKCQHVGDGYCVDCVADSGLVLP